MSYNITLNTTQSIAIKLAGAVTTDQPEWGIHYIDTTGDTPGSLTGYQP